MTQNQNSSPVQENQLTTHHVEYKCDSTGAGCAEVFSCRAEDELHALEQCENAYPQADMINITAIN